MIISLRARLKFRVQKRLDDRESAPYLTSHKRMWKGKSAQNGLDDLVLLSRVNDKEIVDNLLKRYQQDLVYTNIGTVLIAVNPYKTLNCYGQDQIDAYHGSVSHENPPHVYQVAEHMYQHMLSDEESQCCIISGESGAGKTESSKLLMSYIAAVSGKGGSAVEETKRIILESNPLLEAFGNAKTLRNNNSSRFGKYFEIKFTRAGQPYGGNISNFLLEKSRVVSVKPQERNYHIFYQLLKGASAEEKQAYALSTPDYFQYLNASGTYEVEHINDAKDFAECKEAMQICGVNDPSALFKIVSGVLHLGNLTFREQNNAAVVADPSLLQYPAFLLGIDAEQLRLKLTSRLMTTGGKQSAIDVNLNVEQAINTRDALAKALYSRMFDYIIQAVNVAIKKETSDKLLSLSVLDIYGFEVFEKNGFEQLCINYVNEKLQQVFIELTLKSEQEEYVREGIQWNPIEYFNNKIVVDLIEGKRPAGVMPILDDICLQLHAQTDGADEKFVQKLDASIGQHAHYHGHTNYFVVKHYAGQVTYDCHGFCEANKDTLFRDLIILMQSTNSQFIRSLFPEDVSVEDKKRPTTAGFKIRTQGNELVERLMQCTPSYVRCLKPNDKKRPKDWDAARVEHQVRYLNLRENINVRRAGFCYRNVYDKFLRRYALLSPQTYPNFRGSPQDGCVTILKSSGLSQDQWQLGRSKVFIKAPESLFMLEELRERAYDVYARKIQRSWRRYNAQRYYLEAKKRMLQLFYDKKERRRLTLNRDYIGDYIDMLNNPTVRQLVGAKTPVVYANHVKKYDRRWQSSDRDFIISDQHLYILGMEKIKDGQDKGKMLLVLKRKIAITDVSQVQMSTRQDDFVIICIRNAYDNVFEDVFKTELVTVLSETYRKLTQQPLTITFTDRMQYNVKKSTWDRGGVRQLTIQPETKPLGKTVVLSKSTSATVVSVPAGMPKNSQPTPKASKSLARPAQQTYRPQQPQQAQYQPPKAAVPNGLPPMRPPPPMSAIRPPTSPLAQNAPQMPANNNFGSIGTRSPFQRPQMPFMPQQPQQNGFANKNVDMNNSMPNLSNKQQPQQVRPQLVKQISMEQRNNLQSGMSSSTNNLVRPKMPPPIVAPPPKNKPLQFKALYSYTAREADELGFNAGDVITILTKDNEGWWTGLAKGKKGLVPANYLGQV